MIGRLFIEQNGERIIAELSDEGRWACSDASLESYLNSGYRPLSPGPFQDSGVSAVMQAAADLENKTNSVRYQLHVSTVVEDIIRKTIDIERFWRHGGWAPQESAQLLARSRLDRQVSLTHCLRLWLNSPTDESAEGQLILAWTTLGSLVEGFMKLFISVHLQVYEHAPHVVGHSSSPRSPEDLELEQLRQYFEKHVWGDSKGHWNDWIRRVQKRRNAIHTFKDREIGTRPEFFSAIVEYHEFVTELNDRIPYPEGAD